MTSATSIAGYALGHSDRELKRLSAQATMFEPFTLRMLQEAGVSKGMRVLDVGSGSGEVAFLCAALVGLAGEVVGIDKSPSAVDTAQQHARRAGFENVTFVKDDAVERTFEKPFDAIVGRLVLMHQSRPEELLRRLSRWLRPGGIIAFQEFDIDAAQSHPPSPAFDKCMKWIIAAFTATGTDTRMGTKLYSVFLRAGFPGPSMSLDAGLWGGADNPAAVMVTEVVRSLLPVLEKCGIVTAGQIDIGSLQERIQQEILAGGGVAISPSLIGAWTRLP